MASRRSRISRSSSTLENCAASSVPMAPERRPSWTSSRARPSQTRVTCSSSKTWKISRRRTSIRSPDAASVASFSGLRFSKAHRARELELALAANKGVLRSLFHRFDKAQNERIEHVMETIGLVDRSGALAGGLAHGQKQWLKIGMRIWPIHAFSWWTSRSPALTHQEIERRAELLRSLAGEHTVVVIEHDMDFVRSIAERRSPCCTRAKSWPRFDGQGPSGSKWWSKSTQGAEHAGGRILESVYGESHTLWDVEALGQRRNLHLPDGAQMVWEKRRCSKRSWASSSSTAASSRSRASPGERGACHQGQARHRLRAAGARDLSSAHCAREPGDRSLGSTGQEDEATRQSLLAVSRPEEHASSPRRRPLGRTAATTGHWASAVFGPQAPHSGRANGRNSAERSGANRRCADSTTRRRHDAPLGRAKAEIAKRVGQFFTIIDRGRSVAGGSMNDLGEDLVNRYLVV